MRRATDHRAIPGRRRAAGLLRDERAGFRPGGILVSALRRLHRCRRGNITVLFLFLGLVFYICLAMMWNTGVVAAAKIEVQTAADAAAYSATVWTSRSVNLITGTNMLILRNAVAQVSADAVLAVLIGVPIMWIIWILQRAFNCGSPFDPFTVWSFLACLAAATTYVLSVELPPYIKFVVDASDGIEAGFDRRFVRRIDELHDFQLAVRQATPVAIEQQRQAMEHYYGCEIRLTRPGDVGGRIEAPLKDGNALSVAAPFVLRTLREVFFNKDGWYKSDELKLMKTAGKADKAWLVGFAVGVIDGFFAAQGNHSVLETQRHFLERDLGGDDRDVFTVVATARGRGASGGLIAPGLFGSSIAPHDEIVAYAQAEANLGIDGHLDRASDFFRPLALLKVYPYRVWTPWGWQWQPRLTHGEFLDEAIGSDGVTRDWHRRVGVTAGSVDDAATH